MGLTHRRLVQKDALVGGPWLDETLRPGDAGLHTEERLKQGKFAREPAWSVTGTVYFGLRVAFLFVVLDHKPVEVRFGVVGFEHLRS